MESIVYVVVVKPSFKSEGNEYAHAITSSNISLWCSFEAAADRLNRGKQQLLDKGYYVADSAAPDNEYGSVYWVRLEHESGKVSILEVLRKSVSGELVQI